MTSQLKLEETKKLIVVLYRETPLRSFLQASMLSSEGDNDDGTKEVWSALFGQNDPLIIVDFVWDRK